MTNGDQNATLSGNIAPVPALPHVTHEFHSQDSFIIGTRQKAFSIASAMTELETVENECRARDETLWKTGDVGTENLQLL